MVNNRHCEDLSSCCQAKWGRDKQPNPNHMTTVNGNAHGAPCIVVQLWWVEIHEVYLYLQKGLVTGNVTFHDWDKHRWLFSMYLSENCFLVFANCEVTRLSAHEVWRWNIKKQIHFDLCSCSFVCTCLLLFARCEPTRRENKLLKHGWAGGGWNCV